MLRSITFVSLLAPTSLACAGPPAPPPVAVRNPEPPPMTVTYRVQRTGEGGATMLSGRTQLDASHGARVHATAPHDASFEDLNLSTRPNDDGTLGVTVRYEERSADGATIDWQPQVRIARGAPVRIEIAGPGWGRTLDLNVE